MSNDMAHLQSCAQGYHFWNDYGQLRAGSDHCAVCGISE